MELPQRPRRRGGHRRSAGAPKGSGPFGEPLSVTPDTVTSLYEHAWLGQHARGTEVAKNVHTIEISARQYVPSLGRFLEVDPVEGGSDNDYDYVNCNPVNDVARRSQSSLADMEGSEVSQCLEEVQRIREAASGLGNSPQ